MGGVDVLEREDCAIPMSLFNGEIIPYTYWSRQQWTDSVENLKVIKIDEWTNKAPFCLCRRA
jgi:hypothetical protein